MANQSLERNPMTYFPLLHAPECCGYVTLCNFPPNNWEDRTRQERLVQVSWADNGKWHSKLLDQLAFGKSLTIEASDLKGVVPEEALVLLSLSERAFQQSSDELPSPVLPATVLPAWRATLGLRYGPAETSYQGELVPFPDNASLLTFGPFIQPGPGIRNFLLLVNLAKNPCSRKGNLQMLDAESNKIYGDVSIRSNAVNIIDLDAAQLPENKLPVFFSKEMTGIPLYLSIDKTSYMMSMEHTHPPASMAIHGNRWALQKKLKANWLG